MPTPDTRQSCRIGKDVMYVLCRPYFFFFLISTVIAYINHALFCRIMSISNAGFIGQRAIVVLNFGSCFPRSLHLMMGMMCTRYIQPQMS
ncbi:hypothetical protein BD408DRAFT_424860 [Parasitella parasitica]|nr:hypothetical protein BD408DRAFT_424860 [Parasitella parasitica]